MNKSAVLGALGAIMIGVVAYLMFSSGVIGNQPNNNYGPYVPSGPYNQGQMGPQGQMPQGQMPQGQMPQGQAQPAQQSAAPAAPAVQKVVVIKQVKSPPPPPAPAPQLLQTQSQQDLINLINSFGNPAGPDQVKPCYVKVEQDNGSPPTVLGQLPNGEMCNFTPYANGAVVITRTNQEPFFFLYGQAISLLRFDPAYAEFALMAPRSGGFTIQNLNPGPGSCVVGDNGFPGGAVYPNVLLLTVCS